MDLAQKIFFDLNNSFLLSKPLYCTTWMEWKKSKSTDVHGGKLSYWLKVAGCINFFRIQREVCINFLAGCMLQRYNIVYIAVLYTVHTSTHSEFKYFCDGFSFRILFLWIYCQLFFFNCSRNLTAESESYTHSNEKKKYVAIL